MKRVTSASIRLAFGVLALGSLLGAPCDGGQTRTWVTLQPSASTVATFSPLVVDVLVSSPTPIQAFDLGLQWDPAMLSAFALFPHPEFDDDGAFFDGPYWNHPSGRLDRVVDLRHGREGATGNFKVATIWFMSRGTGGSTSIAPTSHGLADADGNTPSVSVAPITITIEP